MKVRGYVDLWTNLQQKIYLNTDLQSEEPNGVVNLKGAIVMESKRIPLAFEIHTGGLYSERGVEKRTYIFTPEGAGTAPSL
jgi:hypothetical protein